VLTAMTAPTTTRDRQDTSPSHAAEAAERGSRHRQPPGLDFLFTAVFAFFGFAVGIERLSDNSFFTHLVTGRYILDHGIPHHDSYSFTAPGTKFVAQSWLAELLYGVLDRTAGPFGIRLLGALTGAAITVLAFRLALRLSRERMRAALISVAALSGLFVLWSERPLLLGLLCFIAGLLVMNTLMTASASGIFASSTHRPRVQALITSLTAVYSLAIGTIFLLGVSDKLPALVR